MSASERPRGLVRTREDEILFVGLLELASRQPCSCLSLPEGQKPCVVCQAATRKAEIEKQREAAR